MSKEVTRPLAGAVMLVIIVALVGVAAMMFAGMTQQSAHVTVTAPRAGLVMDPDAKVQMRGVTVGRVSKIDFDQKDTAELTLEIAPGELEKIPGNVGARIAAPTVFGAKGVELVTPDHPSGRLRADQVLSAKDVEVEVNTVFGDLTEVLSQIRPAELNAALSAISTGLSGRGEQFGQMLSDVNSFMYHTNSALPALRSLLRDAPEVMRVYADTSRPLLGAVRHTSGISDTLVAEQRNLDAFLTSLIGLSNTGDDVLRDNRKSLAKVLKLLVPTSALTDEYNEALTCALDGFGNLAVSPPADFPGLGLSANFLWGAEPYTQSEKPKVAASGGPQCSVLPVKYQQRPPYVVTDTGANPYDGGRKSLELNVKSLQQALFGPIPDGAPR
ncbi:MCE family protein [Gordonia sp. SID5947]|uniref:MCE family protein n=1 Tax=Gordonia sp. SID5947 TaxID=2690315 RepID=UPI001367E264|nr:MCE family protein [Gordonia sp. SID5947]MYR06857.1 MCE family protein [Gordonia sp. SID5947]